MKILETGISGLKIIEPKVFEDERGYFFESFNEQNFADAGFEFCKFIQDNESKSQYGVIRGLHYQLAPFSQSKLVRVLQGKVYDVAVDLRKNSSTFGKWYGLELSGENKKQFYVPRGFAHGFSVLSETAVFSYKCDNYYNPASERGIHIYDPTLNINWQVEKSIAIISSRDSKMPFFAEAEMNF